MEKLKKFLLNHLALFFVIFIGLLPLTWFKDGLLIAGGDEYGLLDPGALTESFKYVWNTKLINEGGIIFSIPRLFPMMYFWTIFKSLGLSLISIEKLWFIFLFLGPGLSMYFLMSQIYNKSWAKVVAPMLYMFNIFVVVSVPFNNNIKPVFIALPLIFAFWVKGLNNLNKGYFKYAILIALSSLLCAGSSVNLPSLAPIPIILLIYLSAFIIKKRKDHLKIFRFVFVSIISYILVNFWWISVFLSTYLEESTSIKVVSTFSALNSGGVAEFFRLLGSWGWKGGNYKMFYYPYAKLYDAPLLLILSFLIPVLSFLAIVLKPKDKKVLFFGFLALVGIFLAKGGAAPFGSIFIWMYENIPFFWIFREPFAKFTPITLFSYSVLLGFTADIVYQKIKSNKKLKEIKLSLISHVFPILLILIVFFVAFPLFDGEAIWSYWNGSQRSLHIKVPDYWYEMGSFLRSFDKDSKVLLTPKGGYGLAYNWEQGFSTADAPAVILLDNPTVRSLPESYTADKIANHVYSFVNANGNSDKNNWFLNYLTILNIKYILQQNDLDFRFAFKDTYSPAIMKNFLQQQSGISLLKSFGKLDLYEVDNQQYLPIVYVPKDNILINTNLDSFFEIENLKTNDIRQQIFLENSKIDINDQDVFSEINTFLLEGELKGRIQKEELGESTSRIAVPPTYAKNKPETLAYKLQLKKEQLDLSEKGKDPVKLFEALAFYASKRIDEILLFKDYSNLLIDEYKKNIDLILATLNDFKENRPKDFLLYLIKTDGLIKIHQLKLESLNLGDGEKQKIDDTFNEYLSKIDELKPRHDFSNLEYNFNIVKEGEYVVFLKDGESLVDLGKRNYTIGPQKIVLPVSQLGESLVGSNMKLKEYFPNTLYRVSISYKSERKRGSISLSEGKLGRLFDVTIPMTKPGNGNYKKYEMFFKSSPSGERAVVNLSVDEFSELKIEKITQPKLLLISKITQEKKIPSITFRRINPTKFIVGVHGAKLPYSLVLNESFNKNWKIYLMKSTRNELNSSLENIKYFDGRIIEQKGKTSFLDKDTFETWGSNPIADEKHFVANGYANSWYISPEDVNNKEDYEIVIEFGLQRIFYIGIGVSALTLIGFFFLLCSCTYNEKINRTVKNFWKNTRFQLLFVLITLITGWILYRKSGLAIKFPILNFNIAKMEKQKEEAVLPSFNDKELNLSYSSKPISIVRELSGFEDNEKWLGDGEFDYLDYYEGKSSLSLASRDSIESEAVLDLKENIQPNDYKFIKFFLKINSDSSKIKGLKLIFSDNRSVPIYEYPVSKFVKGWNLLVIPVDDFSKTESFTDPNKVIFKLLSQPSNSTSINIDGMWAEKDENFYDNWIARDNKFFFFKKHDNSIYLSTANILGSLAILKKITSASNYTFTVKFIPLREGFFGLFLRGDLENGYGYYFIVDGPGSDRWKIFKQGNFGLSQAKTLKEGKFIGYSVEKNLPYWFKVNFLDKHMIFSISSDGNKYVVIGEADDKSYDSGKVGIVSGNLFLLVNDILFIQ